MGSTNHNAAIHVDSIRFVSTSGGKSRALIRSSISSIAAIYVFQVSESAVDLTGVPAWVTVVSQHGRFAANEDTLSRDAKLDE